MKPNQQPRQTTLSEKLYSAMVHLYPFPFRDEFGREMKQVFREQARETAERSGKLGVLFLWLRVIADFVWTCTKEHFLAIPSLPKRTWEHILRKPVWLYPSVLATSWLLLTVIGTYSLTQVYFSSVAIELRKPQLMEPQAFVSDPYFLQTEFAKIKSKAVLYQVISNLSLAKHYQKAYNLKINLRPEETYLYLTSSMKVNQQRNTELIELSVLDLDRLMAKNIANDIAATYKDWKRRSERTKVLIRFGISPAEFSNRDEQAPPTLSASQLQEFNAALNSVDGLVTVINPAEEALRATWPNRKLNIAIGILISGFIGSISYFGLRIAKRKQQKSLAATATLASA